MGDIIQFNKGEELGVEIELTEEYKAKVIEISDFIKDLPLSTADNDKLVALLTDATNQARQDAFLQGFNLGVSIKESH